MALKDESWRLALASYPFRVTIPTRYGDMDSNAHLNNVAIARLVEEARVRFHWRLRDTVPETSPGGVMIVHVAIDYLGEGAYPAEVEAGVAAASVGTSSYRLAIGLFQGGTAIALADSVMVNRAADGPGAAPVSPATRAALEGFHHG